MGCTEVPANLDNGDSVFSWPGERIAHVHHMLDGLWPQVGSYGFRPLMGCMQEGGASVFGDVPNASFSNSVLVMCADPAEGDCFMCRPDVVHKSFVGEPSIITLVVKDSHPVLLCQTFECMFRVDCFVRCLVIVHVDISEVTSMVHKHRSTMVLSDGRLSFRNGYTSWNRGFELVNANHGSWYGRRFDLWINFVHPPWLSMSLSVQTAWTFRWRNLGEFSWNNALLGHLLELSKGAVSKLLMELHEGSLVRL